MSEHSRRKGDHLDLCATDDVAFQQKTTLLDEVQLVHNALPELDVDAISLATTVAGFPVRAPVVISAMTGGVERAERINKSLAAAAQEAGIAFGFGSMRPLLEDSNALGYHVRDVAPTAVLFGTIGGQGGGDTDFRGVVDALARLTSELDIPIIAKETGAGMSRQAGLKLHDAGVRHVDISGAGGTSWVAVETLRARAKTRALGERFWDWGIPTAASIAQIADLAFDTVIATGGIRHGLDIAKALALGATAGGMARPFLMAYNAGGEDAVREQIEQVTHEIRVACLLTGCASVQDLAHSPLVIDPALERWLPGGSSVRARLMHRYA
jgi:isopentenyl-diphosphate delta-isomerase